MTKTKITTTRRVLFYKVSPHATKIIMVLCMLFVSIIHAQDVKNIHFEQQGKMINIYYDLIGEATINFEVKVFYSTDEGKNWQGPLVFVNGDVGKDQKAANSKFATWDVLKEIENLSGNIQFKIEAFQEKDNIEMVFVKGGTFQMGSNYGDESPIHTVYLNDFYIGKYEITQKQWKEVMDNIPSGISQCDNCPIEKISWNDVKGFIKKLNRKTKMNYRLPTEAEWEYAARGGNKNMAYIYSGSNNIDEVAWYGMNSGDKVLTGAWDIDRIYINNSKTHPVGQKQANELGIFDMSGNVTEWCSDWYSDKYYQNSPSNNPQGATSGTMRIIRGGVWFGNAISCGVEERDGAYESYVGTGFGFRLALPKK